MSERARELEVGWLLVKSMGASETCLALGVRFTSVGLLVARSRNL